MPAVRVDEDTHRKLRALAAHESRSMPEIVATAVEAYRRRRFLEEANAEFAVLRADEDAWAEEQAERRAWDATLADGLADDNP
jgi:hypothetical protein